jgi:hypothetical protein
MGARVKKNGRKRLEKKGDAPGPGDGGVQEGLEVEQDDDGGDPDAHEEHEGGPPGAGEEHDGRDQGEGQEHEQAHQQALGPGHRVLVEEVHEEVGQDRARHERVQGRVRDVEVVGLRGAERVVEEQRGVVHGVLQELAVGQRALARHRAPQRPAHVVGGGPVRPVLDQRRREVAQVVAHLRAVREALHVGQDGVAQLPALLGAARVRGGVEGGPAALAEPAVLAVEQGPRRAHVPPLAGHRVEAGEVQGLGVVLGPDRDVDDERHRGQGDGGEEVTRCVEHGPRWEPGNPRGFNTGRRGGSLPATGRRRSRGSRRPAGGTRTRAGSGRARARTSSTPAPSWRCGSCRRRATARAGSP